MQEYSYIEAVQYIEDIPLFGPNVNGRSKSGNENLNYILALLGNPEKTHRAVHIAGTNGKGSVSRFLAVFLMEQNYNVGVFNSPHLIKINERISISDQGILRDINNMEFVEAFMKVKNACDDAQKNGYLHLSYFEFLFAMAAVFYSEKDLDYVIYETGLGGRLDATNTLQPIVSVITSIGLDHMKYLGNSIREIAYEKAGIIKENVPVVYNTGNDTSDLVIETTAQLHSAKAINVTKTDYMIHEITDKTIDFSISNRYYSYSHLVLPVSGAVYQVQNAMTAIETCNLILQGNNSNHFLDKKMSKLTEQQINDAFKKFNWPGRMERIFKNVILDGAHNEDAIEQFVECVNQGFSDKKINLLFAVAADKDYEPMIKILCEKLTFENIYVTAIQSERAISAEYIAGLFKMYTGKYYHTHNVSITSDDDIQSSFQQAYYKVKGTDEVLFCLGSLYLVGSLKQIAREVV